MMNKLTFNTGAVQKLRAMYRRLPEKDTCAGPLKAQRKGVSPRLLHGYVKMHCLRYVCYYVSRLRNQSRKRSLSDGKDFYNMAKKVLMKGNEAIAEAAIASGCLYYFGYPITPQTEISEYLAKECQRSAVFASRRKVKSRL